jgi:hypothetical protein
MRERVFMCLRLSIQPMIARKNNDGHITGQKIDEPRTSIIGARAKSVKGANKYKKIDKRGRIQAQKSIFSFPK